MTEELKHGVLALVDEERMPVVMIATRDTSFSKTMNGYEQRMHSVLFRKTLTLLIDS